MVRGWSAPLSAAVMAGTLLLSGCTNFGPLGNPSAAADSSGADCAGAASSTKTQPPPDGLSGIVSQATCTVSAPAPDTVAIQVDVQIQAPTARGALDAAAGRSDAVVGALRGKGLDPRDVHVGQLAVSPVISPIITSPVTGVGGTRVTGFQASRSIAATARDINTSGSVITSVVDAAGDAGHVQAVYSLADDRGYRAQARAAAIRHASEKAKQMAEAAGVSLGQLVSITEIPPNTGGSTTSGGSSATASTSGGPVGVTEVVDGQAMTVTVDVVYAVG